MLPRTTSPISCAMMPGHGVDRLEESAESLAEIRNRNAVSGAEQNHHRLANHPTESQQNGGNNSESDAGTRTRTMVWRRLAPRA